MLYLKVIEHCTSTIPQLKKKKAIVLIATEQ